MLKTQMAIETQQYYVLLLLTKPLACSGQFQHDGPFFLLFRWYHEYDTVLSKDGIGKLLPEHSGHATLLDFILASLEIDF